MRLPWALMVVLALIGSATRAAPVDEQTFAAFLGTLDPPSRDVIPFVEKRMSALLNEPLEVRGELLIGADGVIDKRVLMPAAERVVITADSLTLERAGKTRRIPLASDPRWKVFHAGIAGLLNRDAEALLRVFDVALSREADSWVLDLRPKQARGKNPITLISAAGAGSQLLRLRIEQSAAEWQEMTLQPPDSQAR